MEHDKPRMFLGCSDEAKDIAEVFMAAIGAEAHVVPWWLAPEFRNTGSVTTFASLVQAANEYDFALFLLTPDDVIESREVVTHAPRDNVVFEFGLFLGAIGPDRTLIRVRKHDPQVKKPSDFGGVKADPFEWVDGDSSRNFASVGKTAVDINSLVRREGFRKIDLQLVFEWHFDTSDKSLKVELSAAKLDRARSTIGKMGLCIAARVEDRFTNMESDTRVVYSDIRYLPERIVDNVPFRIPAASFRQNIGAGAKIEGRIVLVPDTMTFDPDATLQDAVKCRCRVVETFSYTVGAATD